MAAAALRFCDASARCVMHCIRDEVASETEKMRITRREYKTTCSREGPLRSETDTLLFGKVNCCARFELIHLLSSFARTKLLKTSHRRLTPTNPPETRSRIQWHKSSAI